MDIEEHPDNANDYNILRGRLEEGLKSMPVLSGPLSPHVDVDVVLQTRVRVFATE